MDQQATQASPSGATPLGWTRYVRLYQAFARYCLIREMSFQFNFLVRCVTSLTWIALLIVFFELIFLNTQRIGDWTKFEYLFFMGTGFVINSLMNALFLQNCTNLSELIRSGDLDFALLKPVDEQFLLSCQRIDWAAIPNLILGILLLGYSASQTSIPVTPLRIFNYAALVVAGVIILYSVMLAMAASSVWMIRNRGLYELWFYVNQFARYPADIYKGNFLGWILSFTMMFVFPILLAVNVPARYGTEKLDEQWLILYLFGISAVAFYLSRQFFRFALKHYQSASS